VVVVTGASAGIGRAVARAFGRQRARVALIARTDDALENAAAEIRAAGGEALVLPLDLADAPAVDRAAGEVARRFGGLDVWVNDAMVSVFSPVAEMRADEYRRVTEVNYLGTVHGTLAALRHMRARDAGVVVQIGSAPRLPLDPAPERLLRVEGGDPRVHRLAALRAPARPEPGEGDDGAAPGGEHAAVRGRPQPARWPRAAGAADLPAGDHRGGDPVGGRARAARALARLVHDEGDRGAARRPGAARPVAMAAIAARRALAR